MPSEKIIYENLNRWKLKSFLLLHLKSYFLFSYPTLSGRGWADQQNIMDQNQNRLFDLLDRWLYLQKAVED